MNRDFKGIWIPKEIWLNEKLSIQAKALWAEIWSLHDQESGGCYASNDYLCDFLKVKISRLKEIMKEMRDEGCLVEVSFDGRNRVIRAQMPEVNYGGQQIAGIPASSMPENRLSPSRETGQPLYRVEQSRDTNIDTPISPQPEKVAKAPKARVSSLPKKANKEEVSSEARELLPKFIKVIKEFKPRYVVKNEHNILKSIDEMLKEGRKPEDILRVLSWGIRDNVIRGTWSGWSSKILCNNPAAYLNTKFNAIDAASEEKTNRKFGAGSDPERTRKNIEAMMEGAL